MLIYFSIVDKSKGGEGSIIEWQEDMSLEDITKQQNEQYGLSGQMFGSKEKKNDKKGKFICFFYQTLWFTNVIP